MTSFLERLGLHRRELRAWAMYDWANSAFITTVVAAVFPIYYAQVAAAPLAPDDEAFWFSAATTVALTIIAVLSPVLGAMADYAAIKKPRLGGLRVPGLIAAAAMFLICRGDWQLAPVLFMLGNIGVYGTFTFYDSLLPHVAREGEMDRVSTARSAIGY